MNQTVFVDNVSGRVHINDKIYHPEKDFKQSLLFFRIDKYDDTHFNLKLSFKSKTLFHNELHALIRVQLPLRLLEDLQIFQQLRRIPNAQIHQNQMLQVKELALGQQIYQLFFSEQIGQICMNFMALLEARRIETLLLAISADDETILNLPFEMAIPLFFSCPLGEMAARLRDQVFGLVRTTMVSFAEFELGDGVAKAAPLKMLFISALPENLEEHRKMLQMEEEQTRLIQAVGALEATGDSKTKIVIEFLDNASLNELDKALRERKHDIVHISGHGAYQAAQNKGVLYFEDEMGDVSQVTGAQLGETLRKHPCVQLLMLSACETAIAGSGVAQQVSLLGFPCTVAMRFAVTDEGAKLFTTTFYTQLANGFCVNQALGVARAVLYQDMLRKRQYKPNLLCLAEWFTPVVYQNRVVGALMDNELPYDLPNTFYPNSRFLKTQHSRLIGHGFIGRKSYLIRMRQAFRTGKPICLHGLGGLGKTTLAEAFAHHYEHQSHSVLIFRNGHQIQESVILDQLRTHFEADVSMISTLTQTQLKNCLDDPQIDVLEKLQLTIDHVLKGRKTILIFDNVEDVQRSEGGDLQRALGSESLKDFLRYLCQNAPKDCHLLFTTRYKIQDLEDLVESMVLNKMSYAEQYRLLNYSSVLRRIPLKERESVYKQLDGHPRVYEYLEALLKKDKTFRWQQVADSEEKVFENLLLANVYERLSDEEKLGFQMAAMFISRTPLSALESVWKEMNKPVPKRWWQKLFDKPDPSLSVISILEMIRSLCEWSLCFWDEKLQTFEVHRLTRAWVAQNITPKEKIKEWAFIAGNYFKKDFPRTDKVEIVGELGKFETNPKFIEKIETKFTWNNAIVIIIAAKDYFEIAEKWIEFAEAADILEFYYTFSGFYKKAFEINQFVLAKNINNEINCNVLNKIGIIYTYLGQRNNALAYFEKALNRSAQIKGKISILNNIGGIYLEIGDYEKALSSFKLALSIAQKIGKGKDEVSTLIKLSHVYEILGDSTLSVKYFERALEARAQLPVKILDAEIYIYQKLGKIFSDAGDQTTALLYFEYVLELVEKSGNYRLISAVLNEIAGFAAIKNDSELELVSLKQSLTITQQTGDYSDECKVLDRLGSYYANKKDNEKAFYYWEKCLAILQQTGNLS